MNPEQEVELNLNLPKEVYELFHQKILRSKIDANMKHINKAKLFGMLRDDSVSTPAIRKWIRTEKPIGITEYMVNHPAVLYREMKHNQYVIDWSKPGPEIIGPISGMTSNAVTKLLKQSLAELEKRNKQ